MNQTIRKFGHPGTLVQEYQHWVVLQRPQQVTLGSLVLAARSDATDFHDLPEAAFTELKAVVSHVETALSAMVSYQKINYLMLMMVDPEVHFHVIPRYERPAELEGTRFPDHGWPGPPALTQFTETDETLDGAIMARLKSHWPA
jgi:diadenosine tetraphosphate (Ap4A) HIT family hydrolase